MQDGLILVLQGLLCSAERNGGRGVEKENKAGNGNAARGRVARLISRSTSGYKIKELTFILCSTSFLDTRLIIPSATSRRPCDF